jgi:hypothetical protein
MWQVSQSRRRCGTDEPSPGTDVAGVSQSRRRCRTDEPLPSPSADLAQMSPVPAPMLQE